MANYSRQLKVMHLYVSLLLVFVKFSSTMCEYYSSIDAMQKLGKAEAELVQIYGQYVATQRHTLEKYRSFIASVKTQHELALEDVEAYLANPVNAYKLVKRNAVDWSQLNELVKQDNALQQLNLALEKLQQKIAFPTNADVKGAAVGLARLQEIYELETSDLVSGILNGTYYGSKLTWRDCFTIGSNLFDVKNFVQAVDWLEMTIELLTGDEEDVKSTIAENNNDADEKQSSGKLHTDALSVKYLLNTLEYLALSNYELGRFKKALRWMDEILKISPKHHIKEMHSLIRLGKPPKKEIIERASLIDWYANYTRLCRGILVPEEKRDILKCKLETKGSNYFILAPLKTEELSIEPEIALYHGMLNDRQIENILNEANQLGTFRSRYQSGVNESRISQQAWLRYKSPTLRMIYHMATEVTGLDMRNAELMQVANYGIGGHFEAHCDTLGREVLGYIGDRIATLMFYLSNVEQGGYTIYPNLNMYVRPVKGALVIWYNMHRTLVEDTRAMHAGCPLLKGTKRISNIWIHSGYQEFRRPCDLENDNYKSSAYTCNE